VYSNAPASTRFLLGHDLGDHGRARRPFTTDAEARDDAEDDELPHVGDEGAARRAERVQQHGDHQHALAAESVTERPEDHATRGPAEQQDGIEDAVPVGDGGARFRPANLEPNKVGMALGATKLNSSPSKMSKPQPSQAAKNTVH
jgi:hypothetical protein